MYIVCGFKPVRLISGSVTVTGSLPEALACLTAVPVTLNESGAMKSSFSVDMRRHGDLGILTRHDRKGLLAAECHIVVSLDRDVAGLDDRLIFAFV